jgi:hypothetical protein
MFDVAKGDRPAHQIDRAIGVRRYLFGPERQTQARLGVHHRIIPRRLAYSVIESALEPARHNGAAQIIEDTEVTRFVRRTDVLPDDLAPTSRVSWTPGSRPCPRSSAPTLRKRAAT